MTVNVQAADVVIVGGGFSGTMLAAELAHRGISAGVIESGDRAGRGTAFSTPESVHLLNVPAGKMGAWADRPEHFAATVGAEGYAPEDFVPRRRFGAYLRDILDEARAGGLVTVIEGEAIGSAPSDGGWAVSLAGGSNIEGRALVLAQGNQPPEPLRLAQDVGTPLFINNPWSDEGRAAVLRASASGGDVLIIGTGLTMVDVVLSLDAAGHRGRIVALSRRGQVPRGHEANEPAPVEFGVVPQGSVLDLWRWLRRRGAEVGWRAAIDALRPHSHALWQSMNGREQRRFLRHARPWWDVHRHRIAPEVAATVERLRAEGRLEVVAGRIGAMREMGRDLVVEIARRGQTTLPSAFRGLAMEQRFSLGVNCTGPLGAIGRSEDGVLKGLMQAGLARPDALGMGIEVDMRSRVEGAPRALGAGAADQREVLGDCRRS